MIAVIDYGVCNVGSIKNMLKKIGADDVIVTNRPEELKRADRLILPGVGSFDSGMESLEHLGLIEGIKESAVTGRPLLGICLGMQLLGRGSEEGSRSGLGLIPMECRRFQFTRPEEEAAGTKLKIPHMGWDRVTFSKGASKLLDGVESPQRYYFVHSYHAVADDPAYELMSCFYGYRFCAAVQNGNIYGCQFHPEKSHNYGLRLLKNFVERC